MATTSIDAGIVPRAHGRTQIDVMRLVRRTHLYAGLFLTPWVLLYGTTAFLFNHEGAFSDRGAERELAASDFAGTSVAAVPPPAELAGQVVAAVAVRDSAKAIRVVEPEEAEWTGPLVIGAQTKAVNHLLRIDLAAHRGTLAANERPARREEPWFSGEGARLQSVEIARIEASRLVTELGIEAEQARVQTMPSLRFRAESDGRVWDVIYQPERGTVSAVPVGTPWEPLSVRRFLTRLHTTHHYPATFGVRWVWSLIVDCMFVLMVFWALSGVAMWWQLRYLRAIGTGIVIASLIVASILFRGMHGFYSFQPPNLRNQQPGPPRMEGPREGRSDGAGERRGETADAKSGARLGRKTTGP